MYENAMNRFEVEENVSEYIARMEEGKLPRKLRISAVCSDLSIFDWWNDYLSLSQLRQMKRFLKTAGELGFNGYVCFKVGAKGCSNGMWAYTNQSTDGYSPRDGAALYHSFVSGENYWDVQNVYGEWMHEKDPEGVFGFTLKQVKDVLGVA